MKTFQQFLLVVLLSGSTWGLRKYLPKVVLDAVHDLGYDTLALNKLHAPEFRKIYYDNIGQHRLRLAPALLKYHIGRLEKLDVTPDIKDFVEQLIIQLQNLVLVYEEVLNTDYGKDILKQQVKGITYIPPPPPPLLPPNYDEIKDKKSSKKHTN